MKKTLSLFLVILGLASCAKVETLKVSVVNPSSFDRSTEMVEIPLNYLFPKLPLNGNKVYLVKDMSGELVPSQITYDGMLIFQSGADAEGSSSFEISVGKSVEFNPLTYGRFIPERKDDFAWENNRVAFRVYGPALLPIDGPSNGIDAWYKRTEELIIDKWYKNDLAGIASYHEDHGEGQDDYKVGRSLGAGAMAPYINGKLLLNENFVEYEVLDNGPLRTTFTLKYKDLEIEEGKILSDIRTISLDAGSQLNKITQLYETSEPIRVAAGFVKRANNDSIVAGENYIIYVEPESSVVDKVFMGMIFPDGMEEQTIDSYEIIDAKNRVISYSHFLGIATVQPGEPITYYAGYGWSKFGFESESCFESYIRNFKKGMEEPLIVTIE